MNLEALKKEVTAPIPGRENMDQIRFTLFVRGFNKNPNQSNVLRRADALYEVFTQHKKHVYKNDKILGSRRGMIEDKSLINPEGLDQFRAIGYRNFATLADHYGANYRTWLSRGVDGTVAVIKESLKKYAGDVQREDFLNAALKTMEAFSLVFEQYADEAEKLGLSDEAATCRFVAHNKPQTFKQALQLVFMSYIMFVYEGRYAMAFGRMDQYLYPFYLNDKKNGTLTDEEACDLLGCALYKIHEACTIFGGDDVCNIAIGGVKPEDGSDATNELSYLILEAVNNCHIPGPNLSARINKETSPDFIDACLKVVGTGLGYPAMMNDDANIASLMRYGIYSIEDARDYCMVGCIENFIQGKQPPWSDGRYNSPKYMEYALTNGIDMLTGEENGIKTGEAEDLKTMDDFVAAVKAQMSYGAKQYVDYRHKIFEFNPLDLQQPFLSCFCDDCLERGLDINMGGAKYPSAHGAAVMGIGTIADSFAAVEKLVYNDKVMTLGQMRDILKANFEGYEKERKMMLDCPKYGNNDDFADKWAVWFNEVHAEIFDQYRTYDGGMFYIAIASNTSNIPSGRVLGATPDGRLACEAMSDAASPMHGVDKNGPTAALLSLSKPDYALSATGTVVNQKYPPSMFTDDEKRRKLGALIRVYFNRGGQEIQINSVSRDVLKDAMENPDNYKNMVVRVSGFSAFYTRLDQSVQLDILKRTEHESI